MNDPKIDLWFSEWNRIEAVAISAVLFFVFVVLLMRLLGKRTTAQMNNFDWVITVAMGSLVASGILSKTVSISDTLVAMLVLGLCQWITSWLVISWPPVARLVKPTPRFLVKDGASLPSALRKERISTDELFSRLRQHGYANIADVKWVIIETDGRFSVIPDRQADTVGSKADLMGNIKGESGLEIRADDQS